MANNGGYFGCPDHSALARRSASPSRLLRNAPRLANDERLVAMSDPGGDAADLLHAMAKRQGSSVAYSYPASAAKSLFAQLKDSRLAYNVGRRKTMSFLWNWLQQEQIGDVQARASSARFDARAALDSIDILQQRVDRLSLLCQALFEEMEKSTGLSEVRLKERMLEIDRRDGKRDDRMEVAVAGKCPDCGHTITRSRSNCFWCGAKLTGVV